MNRLLLLTVVLAVSLTAGCFVASSREVVHESTTSADGASAPCGGPVAATPRHGDTFAARLCAAGMIASVNDRDQVHKKITLDAAEANRPDIVMESLGRIANVNDRDQAAFDSSMLLLKAGNGRAAVEVAKRIANVNLRDQAFVRLASGG